MPARADVFSKSICSVEPDRRIRKVLEFRRYFRRHGEPGGQYESLSAHSMRDQTLGSFAHLLLYGNNGDTQVRLVSLSVVWHFCDGVISGRVVATTCARKTQKALCLKRNQAIIFQRPEQLKQSFEKKTVAKLTIRLRSSSFVSCSRFPLDNLVR